MNTKKPSPKTINHFLWTVIPTQSLFISAKMQLAKILPLITRKQHLSLALLNTLKDSWHKNQKSYSFFPATLTNRQPAISSSKEFFSSAILEIPTVTKSLNSLGRSQRIQNSPRTAFHTSCALLYCIRR